jgi:mannose-6-phosphate isomerase-like protein (cupin superfamily)
MSNYVVQGNVSFTVNEETTNLFCDDVCIVPKGHHFSYMNTGSSDAILILVHTPHFKLECERSEE